MTYDYPLPRGLRGDLPAPREGIRPISAADTPILPWQRAERRARELAPPPPPQPEVNILAETLRQQEKRVDELFGRETDRRGPVLYPQPSSGGIAER